MIFYSILSLICWVLWLNPLLQEVLTDSCHQQCDCCPGSLLLQQSIKGLILLQVSHNRRWLQIRLQWRWLGISGPNNQTVLLYRVSPKPGSQFCNIFGVKCTTMASDCNLPAECESAQCSSRCMSSAQARTCLSYSLTCVTFVELSRTLLHTMSHIEPHWSQQGDCNRVVRCVCIHNAVRISFTYKDSSLHWHWLHLHADTMRFIQHSFFRQSVL